MADSIVVSYKDNLDEFIKQLKIVRDQNVTLTKQVEDFGNKSKAASDKASAGIKEVGKQTTATGNLFNNLGTQIAAAFSVGAVIAWSKTTLNSYKEQEKALVQLKTSLETVANEGTRAFSKLVGQAERLQKVSIFSDEQIEQTQTMLVNFGLTSRQTEILTARIVDFASRTNKSLDESTSIFLRALEGQGRGLTTVGAKFEDTGSRVGNFNALLESTEKFAGGVATALKTQAGELENIKNRIDDINEETGKTLSGLELIVANIKLFAARVGDAFTTVDKFSRGRKFLEIFIGKPEEAAELAKELDATGKALDSLAQKQERLQRAKLGLDKAIIGLSDKDIKDEIARLNSLAEANTIAVKDRIDLLNKELEERKKNAPKIAEARLKEEKRVNDEISKINEDNFKLAEENLKKFQAEQISLIESQNIDREEKEKQFAALELQILEGRRQNYIDYGKDIGDINVQIANKHVELNKRQEKSDEELADVRKSIQDDLLKNAEELGGRLDKIAEEEAEKKKKLLQDVFDLAASLSQSLGDLFSAQDEAEIERINNNKDERVTAIDAQIEALEEANDRGRLSDKQLETQKKKLIAERAAAEKRALEEQNNIKRKEAERDKLLSIFRIGLLLAEAIAEGNVIKAIAAGLELAIVTATPIPAFAKGTGKEGTKKSGLGIVGEKGAELVNMPAGTQVLTAEKTKKHRAAIDAMIENRYDDYVYKAMIAPALREAAKKMEKDKHKSFAENIANSFLINKEGMNEYRMADALKMNNKEQAAMIASALAKHLNKNNNDRYYH